jgi:hypothetical protein
MKKTLVFGALLCALPFFVCAQNLDSAVNKAVRDLGATLGKQITVGVGRITIADTRSVSSLSDFLRRAVADGASGNRAKFRVAGDAEVNEHATRSIDPRRGNSSGAGALEGIIEGSFYQLGADVEVRLRLKSTMKGEIWGRSTFVIPAAELKKRDLAFLPPKGEDAASEVSKEEFEEKQAVAEAFSEKNNAFELKAGLHGNAAGILYEGDPMGILIHANRDCYIKVWLIDAEGYRKLLFPNRFEPDNNFVRAGESKRIPDTSHFEMEAPYGEEYIEVAAYDEAFAFDPEEETAMKIRSVAAPGFDNGTRGIKVGAKKGRLEKAPVATTKFSYTILRAK